MRFATVLIAIFASASSALAAVSNNGIVTNGGFDSGLDGWTVQTSRNGVIYSGADTYGSGAGTLGWHWDSSKRAVDGTIPDHYAILSQSISLTANAYYTLSFTAKMADNADSTTYFLRASVGGAYVTQGVSMTDQGQSFSFAFQAPASTSGGVTLAFESNNADTVTYLDNIGIIPVLTGSQAATAAKRRLAERDDDELCPSASSMACPISLWEFRLDLATNPKVLKKVGYECVEVAQDLESCGGCATIPGAGVNCLDIPHVDNVGCDAGVCVITTCDADYQLSEDGSACVAI